jgi:hypothetical protein
VHVFGIVEEAKKKGHIYLFGESDRLDRPTGYTGSNSVISMLYHWFIMNKHRWPMRLHIHTDNCSGQNKNNMMVHFLMWAVQMSMLHDCCISFMLPGHTKFAPDAYFGMFKSRYYLADKIDDMVDLMDIVRSATKGGHLEPVHFAPNEDPACVWYDWKALSKVYINVQNIKKHHHIYIYGRDHQHMMKARALIGSEWSEDVCLYRNGDSILPSITDIPVIPCNEIADWRKLQLHNEILEHVQDETKRSMMWPLPDDTCACSPPPMHTEELERPPVHAMERQRVDIDPHCSIFQPKAVTEAPLLTLADILSDSEDDDDYPVIRPTYQPPLDDIMESESDTDSMEASLHDNRRRTVQVVEDDPSIPTKKTRTRANIRRAANPAYVFY